MNSEYFQAMLNLGSTTPLTTEPLTMTVEQHIEEEKLVQEALAKPAVKVLPIDDLRGLPVEGYEGTYWYTLPDDLTPCGILTSGAGVRIPSVTHIPTGSTVSYRKVYKNINGVKTPVWEVHQKDLTTHHEPYDV